MKLYRYISFESFVDLIQTSSLCFSYPPIAWDDTFEGFLYRALKTPQGKQKILSLIDSDEQRLFAETILSDATLNQSRYLCWTRAKDKVALWSIYNYMNKAIMICTTSKKIEELKYENRNVALMQVNYVSSISLEDEVKFIQGKTIFTPNIFRTKRRDFKHENEVRAHIGTLNKIDPRTPLRVQIPNLLSFLDGVMVHPSAPSWYVGVVEEYCKINKIKFLGQSKLYKFEV